MGQRFSTAIFALACAALLANALPAAAYEATGRWVSTASGSAGVAGDPVTLTWSIVADGTNLTGQGPSDLVSFLDTNLGLGPGGSDLTQRPWFPHFSTAFDRWSELSGITYVYEPNDDGVTQGDTFTGILGVRGDVRLGGASIDGVAGTVAFNYFPDIGDMVLDTDDVDYFSNSSFNFRRFRNTVMHEAGHGFGLAHMESSTSRFLLEPSIPPLFDGPQFDDIRGVQALYGDFYEKSNSSLGNDSAALATGLGAIAAGSTVSLGLDAVDTVVGWTDIDFLSIDSNADTDFFSFTVDGPSLLEVALTPLGPTYSQGPEGGSQSSIDTSALSDLALAVFDTDGISLLGTADLVGVGLAESLTALSLPGAGEYYVRVAGADAAIQFYQLDLSVESAVTYFEADFNEDGDVDADDLSAWQASFGVDAGGDTDGDGDSDGVDFLTWQSQLGSSGPFSPAISVPEPSAFGLALLAGLTLLVRRV
ncbi:MAG: matrixin family metalloprotease [Planctomycetes bacterium]|nr:matrixin family metalloprotease [Planctomycetota bacterium]